MNRINMLDNFINLVTINDDCLNIYNKIINYGINNITKNEIKLDSKIKLLDKYNNKINYIINDNIIEINSIDTLDNDLYELNLNVKFSKIKNLFDNLINYLIKKKMRFKIIIDGNKQVNNLIVVVDNNDNILKITDYINTRLSDLFYKLSWFSITDEKVAISLYRKYSYYEILSMYIKMYKENGEYNDFKKFIIDNYCDLETCNNLDKYLWFNTKNIKLSVFFNNLVDITMIIFKRLGEESFLDVCDYLKKMKKDKHTDKYKIYDNLSEDEKLFKELVIYMTDKYGENDTKENLINYLKTKKVSYITRGNSFRKRVVESKTFIFYLKNISILEEIDKIIYNEKFNNKKQILENICKETYMSCQNEEKKYSGKLQVARCLIRISYGDFSSVTRVNGARDEAKKNISPEEIYEIIKFSLNIDDRISENEVYEMYAEYIQKLCIGKYA